MRRIFILLILGLLILPATAQVVITPAPHQDGYFTMEDMWRVSLINPGQQTLKAQLVIELENAQHHLVLRATSPVFNVLPGVNRPGINMSFASSQFGSIPAAGVLRSTGRLPYGNYILCYQLLDVGTSSAVGQYCQEETVKPFSPPELVSPFDREEITTTYPLLTWKPPFPPGSTPFEYAIRLVEIDARQHAVEALERNQPMLNQGGLFVTTMMYPGYAPKLESGKTYAWQVSARAGDFELGATEIWVFKIVEMSEMAPTGAYKSFRELQLQPSGSYNPAEQKIKFAYNNRLGSPSLKYGAASAASRDTVFFKIYPVGNPASPISLGSTTTLIQGMNKVTIDLQSATGLNDEEDYIMILRELTGKEYFLEFTYFE